MKTASVLIRCLAVSVFVASGVRVLSQGVPLGQFEGHGDIGAPTNAGSASYNAADQSYRLAGSGVNVWSTNDQFQFAWKQMNGDFIVRARVEFVGKGVE